MATAGADLDLGADGSLPGRPGDLSLGQVSRGRNRRRAPDGAALNLAEGSAHHVPGYAHADANSPRHANADADRKGHADQFGVSNADQFGRPDRDAAPDRHSDAIAVLDSRGSHTPRVALRGRETRRCPALRPGTPDRASVDAARPVRRAD